MIELQAYLKDNISNMESVYGFCREAINDGVYRVTRDPKYRERPKWYRGDHVKGMMVRYVTLVELDNRFGTSKAAIQDREFVLRVLSETISPRKTVEDIALDMLDATMDILRELRVQAKVGEKTNVQLISRSSELIAASALRVRDLNKGFEQVDDRVIKLKGNG